MPVIKILDGGLGTSLEDEYGVKFDPSMPLWSSHFLVTDPDLLLRCQRDFGDAGVDVILTPTYQVSREGFARTKTPEFPGGIRTDEEIRPFLATAVDIAEKAKGREAAEIALSLGPYGATMVPGQEYSGAYDAAHDSEEALYEWHLARLRLFTGISGAVERVGYVAFETIPRVDEIRAVRRAAHDAGLSGKRVWVSCVFPGENDALPDGTSVSGVVDAALGSLAHGVDLWGIGINCTKIQRIPQLLGKYEKAVADIASVDQLRKLPALVLYPDGTNGEVYNTATQTWEIPEGRDEHGSEGDATDWEIQLAIVVRESKARGVFTSFLVGGCCKASHRHIKNLRLKLAGESL